ncbi:p-type ATPase family member protein [Theileria equi strain WA]|uniref:P-type ATPase family member protein n=1 Tax=Theileria equi strain WA TaxID=1537102 RepID=L1LEJ9_THEEQ|nr:p-type ATPase family member protein [Theileria equi strain WA]EKX73709.1 p-type ATPase family member protein [Theileria equi strain WA]|eukprot:XP_004833161.1 p-type ATPase family member protein [Theileria equi strain WA]
MVDKDGEPTEEISTKLSSESKLEHDFSTLVIVPNSELQDVPATRTSSINITKQLSKIISSPSYPGFADAIEMDVVQRLSKSHVNPGDVIELVRLKDEGKFQEAISFVEETQPTSGKSHFAFAPVEQIMQQFGLEDITQGLTSSQVALNSELYGKNILDVGHKDPIWKIYLNQFCSVVILLLFAAAIASFALKNIVEGTFILLIMNINAALATYMENSAANVLDKLAEMSSPCCTVIREGVTTLLDSKEVVPGDVVMLKTGDTVAADMRVFDVMEMRVNEALLTGESEDVKKTLEAADLESPFSSNLCFASTSVTAGSGRAIVVNTGMNTQVGKIAKQLKKASEGSKLTPLQRGLNRLGGVIGIISALVLVTIVIVAVVTGFDDPTRPNSNKVLSIVLLAVGFAASSIPEGLPMVVTISLSIGAKDMAKKNANIRKLPAVETLGCCSIVCSDKTGTLTEGKMTATTIVTLRHENSGATAKRHLFYPTLGFNPLGGVFEPKDLTEDLKTSLTLHAKNSQSFQNVDKNVCAEGVDSLNSKHIKTCMLTAYINSYGTRVETDKNGKWVAAGNMTESPLVVAATKCGIGNVLDSNDDTHDLYQRIDTLEIPFSSVRKLMCTVHKLPEENLYAKLNLSRAGSTFTHIAAIKGAPDMLMPVCSLVVNGSDDNLFIDWSDQITKGKIPEESLKIMSEENESLSSQALRVLLLAICPLTDSDVESLSNCEDADGRLALIKALPMVFLGFIGSIDPPRHGVKDAIETCKRAGVRVIMITGDQKATASAVARDIGLSNTHANSSRDSTVKMSHLPDDGFAIECNALHISHSHLNGYLPEEQLDYMTRTYSVFCRAQPEDKVAIVESLKRQGYLTAMTGDGVNDAAALKTADIGIAMGINGTDVAKGASEMVLLDDNFCTIVNSIESGRTIYANIQKFVSFLLGTNIGEILYLTISILISTLPPVEALQILFLNFMTDGCPAVALSREPPDDDTMSKKPRLPKQPIMTKTWWIYGNLPHTVFEAGAVICSILLALYWCTGVCTLSGLHDQCKHIILKDHENVEHNLVYFCKSYEYRLTREYKGWVTNINYYDLTDLKMKTFLGAALGKVEKLTPSSPELHPDIKKSFEALKKSGIPEKFRKFVELDQDGWVKPLKTQTIPSNPDQLYGAAPPGFYDITGRKTIQARTISFITAVWCEMLRAYTVRSWDYFFKVFNRNPWMHVACSVSATATFAITIIPKISTIMHTVSLTWWQYLFAVALALLTMVLDECIPKVIYRKMIKHNKIDN